MMIIGGVLPTMSWAALGGIFTELFHERYRYSALGFAYALAAVVSGFIPTVTAGLGVAFNAKPAVRERANVVVDPVDLREILPLLPR